MTTTLAEFLAALYPDVNAGLVDCRALKPGVRGRDYFRPDDVAGIAGFIKTHDATNVYMGVALRADKTNGEKPNCALLAALYADIDFKNFKHADDGTERTEEERIAAATALLAAYKLPPSIIVKSGGGLHGYWLLRAPVDPRVADVEPRLKALVAALNADPSAAEYARVLRLPDTVNVDAAKYGPMPRPVFVDVFEPTRRYALDDFPETAPETAARTKAAKGAKDADGWTRQTGGMNPPGWADDLIVSGVPEDDERGRNNEAIRLVGHYRPLIGESSTRILMAHYGAQSKFDADEDAKLDRMITTAYENPPFYKPHAEDEDTGQDDPAAAVDAFVKRLLSVKEDRVMSTGLTRLDDTLNGGLYPGKLVYIAASAGVGKSVLALQIAWTVAKSGRLVLYDSLEMGRDEQHCRLFGQMSGIPAARITNLWYRENAVAIDRTNYTAIAGDIRKMPLVIRHDLRSLDRLEAWIKRRTPALVIIDQFQHLTSPAGTSGRDALEANSSRLVGMTRAYDVTIIGISQVNRPTGDARQKKSRPNSYSLRGSEQLYHDADTVLLLDRPDPHILEINVPKGRMGGGGEDWHPFEYTPVTVQIGNGMGTPTVKPKVEPTAAKAEGDAAKVPKARGKRGPIA